MLVILELEKNQRRTIEIIEALGLKDQMKTQPRSLSEV